MSVRRNVVHGASEERLQKLMDERLRTVRRYNEDKPREDHVLLGVGLGFGLLLRIGDAEVFGVEVNSACILGETNAKGYDILVTQAVRERASGDVAFEAFEPVPPGAGGAYRVLYSPSDAS